jgi:hypothetical protein
MIRSRLRHALDWRFRGVISRLDAIGARVHELEVAQSAADRRLTEVGEAVGRLAELATRLAQVAEDASATRHALEHGVQPMLRTILDEEAANRRRLFSLRDSASYAAAYDDPDPLISIVVATDGDGEPLLRCALPSLLAQTHANLEVVVVGDAVSPELERALERIDDPRVRFANLTQRVVSHPEPSRHRLVGSTMARNEGARRVRGMWMTHFDHDDHLRPDALASLLQLARGRRAEVAYGGFEQHDPDGRSSLHVRFPPERESFAWPAAILHSGLRFFERELVASDLGLPGDMYLLVRMLRAGIRFAMLDEIVLDYFPSRLWGRSGAATSTSIVASLSHPSPVAQTQRA